MAAVKIGNFVRPADTVPLATIIQKRDGCDRVSALQRAVDENPARFEDYCHAVGR